MSQSYKVKGTSLQKKAIEHLVANGGNVNKAMIEAGYSKKTAHNPNKLTDSRGWKELMAQYGLTESLIATSLVADIKNKPQERVKELGLGADILRMRTRENPPNISINFNQLKQEYR